MICGVAKVQLVAEHDMGGGGVIVIQAASLLCSDHQEILPNQINWALNAFSTFNDLKIKSYINIKRNSYLAQMSI